MKKAFTLVELIFVIVILGILAAVAIPKFSATRDDARVSKKAMDVMTAVSDIAAYAMANGQTLADLSAMSHALKSMQNTGEAVVDVANKRADIKMGSVSDCVTIKIITSATSDDLNISFGNAGTDSLCSALQRAVDVSFYPIRLRGTNVSYNN